ncbi:MAG: LTA synthase family protein, partial [Lachnospiraceae bacterium]|nr:LTA synthase family protein [Lachnospiraceae bacterium]
SWIWTVPLYLLGPRITTWCIQYIILEPDLFKKTKKRIWKYNILCVAALYLGLLVLIAGVRLAWIATHAFFMVAAFADYFVYEFRQNEITFGDLTTIGTGLSVAKNYRFVLHDRGAIVLLLTILMFIAVWKLNPRFGTYTIPFLPGRKSEHFRVPGILRKHVLLRAASGIALYMVVTYLAAHAMGIATQTWEKKGTYRNGFVLNFILGAQDSIIHPPEEYSSETMASLEQEYLEKAQKAQEENLASNTAASSQKTTIITIMNESYADFRYVGDLQTNVEVMPFLDSLTENTLRGFALSSVYGAKTPNSEWEYMTGGSLAFLPSGAVVYQQYLDDEPSSIVSTLKNEGYTTIAMHPYYSTGWSRNSIYPDLGFDEMYFMDDGYFDETKLIRNYISDEEMYDKLIARYEQKEEGEPLFIMGITMQNHGGYKDTYDNFTSDVHYEGGYYTDADQFLTLEKISDEALEKLIDYFSRVDEPVEIVFFGDHLPSLNAAFLRSLNGKGASGLTLSELERLFSVPYVIWTNYDTPEETDKNTSLNFLSTMVLERAGIDLPPYNQFMKELQEVVPAINARGYYSLTKKKYIHVEDAEGEEKEWITKYEMLQYNSLFDLKHRSSIFFPYLQSGT